MTVSSGAAEMTPAEHPRKLNVGCGHLIREDWVNLDLAPLPGVDVVHDLDSGPLPFEDGAFDYIECLDVLEHVRDMPAVMRELHRVLAPGGVLHIEGPHFTSYTWPTDPTHQRAFAINTFEFFVEGGLHDRGYYFDFAFSGTRLRHIAFQQVFFLPWNRVVEWVVNRNRKLQGFYEASFMARLFPGHKVVYELVR
ncbi:hypothetical protein GCM10011584_32700 [Nocardioides phosphati]|uniref:Methyltransferase type 11 domain-containing protein n=1 Tax=Nocardioides phosphati TaxID=1867775 RepID=A0ABQ2NF15_9ACTN|nr:class I SAM-dependent methyltransferase [Nocardioides phosphati]GGO93606.1 hypothetical protein GCM10011584_32700 [Nocardioides phosphati]